MPSITQRTLAGLDATGKDFFVRDDKLIGFGIKVTSKGNASYIVEARVKGGRTVRKTLGRVDLLPLDDARTEARGELLKLKKGLDIIRSAPPPELPPESLGQALSTYLSIRRHHLASTTARDYQKTLERCFEDWLPRPFSLITEKDVINRYAHLQDAGLSVGYITKAFRNLKAILNSTNLMVNPVGALRKHDFARQATPRDRYLSGAEVGTIMDAYSDKTEIVHDYRTYALLIFYMLTGCRRSEALSLAWQDISEETIIIRKTKNGRPHIIPLVGTMKSLLGKRGEPLEKVFPFTENSFRTAENKARIELNFPKWTVHDLRRTFAEHLQLIGYDAHMIGMALNHAPASVVSRSYLSGGLAKKAALTKMYLDLQRQYVAYQFGDTDDRKISQQELDTIFQEMTGDSGVIDDNGIEW